MFTALIQMNSQLDYKVNLEFIHSQIEKIKSLHPGIEAVFLPEVFYSMSDGKNPTPYLIEDGNEHYQNIAAISKKHNLYILGGTAATINPLSSKVLNRCYNFDPSGGEIGAYDKIHLFAVNLRSDTKSTVINEGDVYSSGSKLNILNLGNLKLGLSICFDLRFPELYREYFKQGANVFTISSAFTVPTGKAHWETLVRARAIENQSYVIACNQWGKHNDKMETYGHSMIVNPWGEIIASLKDGVGFCTAEIDFDLIQKVRGRIDMSSRLPKQIT